MSFAIALSFLLLSSSLAASEAVGDVPTPFLGNWGGSPDCTSDDDDLSLRIDRRQLSYYEHSGPFKAIVVRGSHEIAFIAELFGEGHTWFATASFRLSPDGDQLIDDTHEIVRYRCPAPTDTRPNNSFKPTPLRGAA